ncbi:hypothetical protein [Ensifer sesbaniae]|jgi:hypothetical protein|nr:hypothetical protein [Ensifer sesbaniae]
MISHDNAEQVVVRRRGARALPDKAGACLKGEVKGHLSRMPAAAGPVG